MNTSFRIRQLMRWGIKGGMSILDQGIYSGANFVSAIILARWQQPHDYGVYSVAFAAFLFLSGIYTGMVLEPVTIFAPSRFNLDQHDYVYKQIVIHFLAALPLSAIMFICCLFIRDNLLQNVCQFVSLALPFMLLPGFGRRMYYIDHKPAGAFICSLIYAATLFAGLSLSWKSNNFSVLKFFMFMAIGGLLSVLPLARQAISFKKDPIDSSKTALEIARVYWGLGKWIVLGMFFLLLSELMPVLIITALSGLKSAGIFKALQNLIQPMVQIETALSLAGLPVLASEFTRKNFSSFRRTGFVLMGSMTGLAVLYALILWFWRDEIASMLYRGRLDAYADLILLFGLVPILIGLFSGYSLSVRVFQMKQVYVLSGIIPFIFGVPVCYYLTQRHGVAGVVVGVVFIQLVIFIVNFALYHWLVPKE